MVGGTQEMSIAYPEPAHLPRADTTFTIQLASPIVTEPKEQFTPLPPKKQPPLIRNARHTYGAVYQRLFVLVFLANLAALIVVLHNVDFNSERMLSNLATASAANILIAISIRQEYVINTIFKTCWLIPKWAPLRIRRIAAKCYEFGGIHSGAATSSTIWCILFTSILMKRATEDENRAQYSAVLAIAWILLFVLVAICIFAIPQFRVVSHNTFEIIHRFAGWTSLALFWVELVLFAKFVSRGQRSLGRFLVQEPALYLLIVTTAFVIWPWLLLRKLQMRAEYLSDRAVRLHFTGYRIPHFSGIALSTSPLLEWHAFACMTSPDGGGSVLISNAGDWTRDTVYSPKPYYWVRGIPVTGVLNMAQVFDKVVIVTTGSGIGPVLSYLVGDKRNGKCRIIWAVPDPICTYGKETVESVKQIDPSAIIWNTRKLGRPDLVRIAYHYYVEFGAEAVFTISNPKTTRSIVYGLESRGIPGFGPVWDS